MLINVGQPYMCVEKKLEGQQVGECQCGRRRSTRDASTFSVRTEISELLILNIQKQIRIGT